MCTHTVHIGQTWIPTSLAFVNFARGSLIFF